MSFIDRYLPDLLSQATQILSEPVAALVATVLLLLLLHRHNLLSYGTHIREAASMGAMILLSVSQIGAGAYGISVMSLASIMMVFLSEYIIGSISLHRSPFLAFNIGFGIGLLAFMDPAWLYMLIAYGIMLQRIGHGTWRHYSALILGAVATTWLGMLVAASPSWEGIQHFLQVTYGSALTLSLPSVEGWIRIGSVALLLTVVTVSTFIVQGHAIARYRWVTHLHLELAWLLMLIQCLFYTDSTPSLLFASFFGISAITTFLTTHSRRPVLMLTALAIPLAGILLAHFIPIS